MVNAKSTNLICTLHVLRLGVHALLLMSFLPRLDLFDKAAHAHPAPWQLQDAAHAEPARTAKVTTR